MENFFKEIEEKLKKEINIESIRIIDNSVSIQHINFLIKINFI